MTSAPGIQLAGVRTLKMDSQLLRSNTKPRDRASHVRNEWMDALGKGGRLQTIHHSDHLGGVHPDCGREVKNKPEAAVGVDDECGAGFERDPLGSSVRIEVVFVLFVEAVWLRESCR